ncbi:insulinase family protein [Fulvivirgaceae bacterium PWU20]|uniref:Insulinase family protein n=2 Tax=Chryseosolibacter indicus TaxID=2782351 RepID=A0ABS5VTP7_9BACT|nr:insulinase family protein [Chryseosolibacter indicus]
MVMSPAIAQKKKGKDSGKTPEAIPVENKAALAPPVKVTSVEGITEYRLQNGLRVLLFPDQSKQTITVNITYMVGSKHENYGETGMAHLLEHLVFKGTPKHPNIPQELTEHGARPNGTTWTDRTNYFETFNATEENLTWALDLEADRMVNSFIAKKDLDSEMTVVRNEFESGENNPFGILLQRVMSTAYLWHNYGKSTIGSRADLENVPIERLQAFYKKYYQPDNAVLTVVGKIDEEKTLKMINEKFGVVPKPTREIQPTYTMDPTQDGERSVVLRRVGDVQVAISAYHIPAGSHPDFAAIDVLTQVLGSEPSGRLYKALVDSKKASNAGSFNFQLKEPGLLFTFAQVLKEKSLDDAKATMLKTLDDLTANPPTKEEVERAKNELIKQMELMYNSSERIGLSLSESIGAGDWRLMFLHRDRVKAVTVDDVKRVAAQYLKPDNRTSGVFIPTEKPERSDIPPVPDVEAMVKDYKGNEALAAGEAFDPSPANIESRVKRSDLPNGMKLALLSKKTRGESVEARITLRFGDEKTLSGKGTAAEFAASLLDRGTAKHTRQQIKDEFDRLKANVFIGGGATQAYVNITTTKPNLAEVLKLVTEVLREPIFPADEFEKLKNEQLAEIESNRSEPQAIAITNIQRHINPYPKTDPRYIATFDEDIANIKALTLDEVKNFYKTFYGTSNATMSIVGDFDADAITKMVTDLLGNWKSTAQFTRLVSKATPVEQINKNFETPDKANAFFAAAFNFEMRDDNPDYPALVLGNYMLGGGFLNSRLATRIRQKEGLSYGVGSQFNAGSLDPVGNFFAYAIYAPENAEKLEAAFKDEIQKVITTGFTAEEIAAAKSGWTQSRTVARSQDGGLAGTLNNYLFIKRDLSFDKKLEDKVMALTPEQINAAMKKYLTPDKINIIKAGDFAKAKKVAGSN